MDPKTELLLQMISQPAFYAKDGIVQWHNDPAQYLVSDGQTVVSLLNDSAKLYLLWDRKGPMQMSFSFFGVKYNAKVRIIEDGELFVLENSGNHQYENGSALSHVSNHLRRILQELITSLTSLQESVPKDQVLPQETEVLNRSVYRLLRLCTQISDGGNLMQNCANALFESTNIKEFLDKLVGEASALLEESGWHLEYIPCNEEITALLDRELTGRALYHLISGAVKRSIPHESVTIEAWEEQSLVCFCVSYKAASGFLGGFFADSTDSHGIDYRSDGLSSDVVKLIAELHGGSVLSSVSEEDRKIRMVFSVKKYNNRFSLHCPMVHQREFMSFHRGLVELSEVLDRSLYHPDKV